MMAIRKAGATIGNADLRGGTLYSTLQPCGMCTMATIWSKVSRVVFGAGREDVHAMYFEARHVDTLAFIANAYRHNIRIDGDACAKPVRRFITAQMMTSRVKNKTISDPSCAHLRDEWESFRFDSSHKRHLIPRPPQQPTVWRRRRRAAHGATKPLYPACSQPP
jgi:Cytidine and deoxycytidylate deaminase zinc-binding region